MPPSPTLLHPSNQSTYLPPLPECYLQDGQEVFSSPRQPDARIEQGAVQKYGSAFELHLANDLACAADCGEFA